MAALKRQDLSLHILCKGTSKQQKHMLSHANKELIQCLCECAHNILKGTVKLTKEQEKYISKHQRELKTLAFTRVPIKYKKGVLTQRGAGKFFQTILQPIIKQFLK